MAVYAIGDVQGCYGPLSRLLEKIQFDPSRDRLWFTGDLVNRGPESLAVLRLVNSLDPYTITVLGNHDLHMLAVANGIRKYKRNDSFDDVLKADDGMELLEWLRKQPLFHVDASLGYCLVHAGILPTWSVHEAQTLASEVTGILRGQNWLPLLQGMYGDAPCEWAWELESWDRYRVIINTMTRMRFLDDSGRLDFTCKGPPGTQPKDWAPWYEHRSGVQQRVVFGHWSALGARVVPNGICLDSGCVWGGELTAVRLDADELLFKHVKC